MTLPADTSQGPRRGEPGELATLLEMQGTMDKETAVNLMRPSAIREAAQLVTFQTAIAWRYRQLVADTEAYSAVMDTAFNFGPLLMTQGEALILPPVLTRAGASLRIESDETATAAQSSFELLSPARYVSVAPNWREFLMVEAFPEPEKPNPAVMPKTTRNGASGGLPCAKPGRRGWKRRISFLPIMWPVWRVPIAASCSTTCLRPNTS